MSDEYPIFSRTQWESLEARLELAPRQIQIVRQLFMGRGDKQIANELGLALPTVRSHLRRVYGKLDVQDRTDLVLCIVHEFVRMDGTHRVIVPADDRAPHGPDTIGDAGGGSLT